MTDLPTLKALQALIRNATGPDSQLDLAILEALDSDCVDILRDLNDDNMFDLAELAPNFTTYPEGLGVCVQLMHEMLPGYAWEHFHNGYMTVGIFSLDDFNPRSGSKPLANDCLTFIDAILSAYMAQQEARDGVK